MQRIISKYRGALKSIIPPSFTLSFWAGIILFAAIFIGDDFVFDIKMLKMVLALEAVMIPFTAILIGTFTLIYKITVFSDGISSYDPWGSMKCDFMKYSDMADIKIRSVFGYKYYFIYSETHSKTLWIPFNVKNKDRFKETLCSIMGSTHPIIKGLDNLKA